ncbi:hypothetical protein [Hydrogenivirga sp.]
MKLLFTALFFLSFVTFVRAVPALSPEEELSGEVVGYSVLRARLMGMSPPNMVVYEISIQSHRKLRFSDSYVVRVLSKRPVPSWVFGKTLRVKVLYRGDERGGAYWLRRVLEIR